MSSVAGKESGKDLLRVLIYTKDGEFVRSTQLDVEDIDYVKGITVTVEGRIALVSVSIYASPRQGTRCVKITMPDERAHLNIYFRKKKNEINQY